MQHNDNRVDEQDEKDGFSGEIRIEETISQIGTTENLLRNRILFVLMGMGTLFPYNSLLTCVDYFADIHPEESDVAGQVAASTLTALLVTTIILIPATTVTSSSRWNCIMSFASAEFRIVAGYGLVCLLLVVFAFLKAPSMQTINSLSFLIGMADATSQSGLYVFAASFQQPSYSAAVSLGSAISGMAVSVLRVLTRALISDLAKGATFLFLICAIYMVICISAYFFTKRQLQNIQNINSIEITNDFVNRYQSSNTKNSNQYELSSAQGFTTSHDPLPLCTITTNVNNDGEMPQRNDNIHHVQNKLDISSYRMICTMIWKQLISTFMTFFITLSLFPGTIAAIRSTSSKTMTSWMPVLLITTFNAADCLGRIPFGSESWKFSKYLLQQHNMQTFGPNDQTYYYYELPNYQTMIWIPTWIRILFYPTIALCVLPSLDDPFIKSDLMYVLIVFLFAWTNGFIQCANFTATPTMILEHETKQRDASSLLLLLAAFLGLTCGANFGLFVVNKILL